MLARQLACALLLTLAMGGAARAAEEESATPVTDAEPTFTAPTEEVTPTPPPGQDPQDQPVLTTEPTA